MEAMHLKLEQQAQSVYKPGKPIRLFFEYVFMQSKGEDTVIKTLRPEIASELLQCKEERRLVTA